jgi:hypothetical protein
MNENFHEYIFYIFSFNKKQDILPNSIYNETSKKKVLVYITDELGYVPYHLSSHYHAIFKVYLQSDKFDVQNIFNFSVSCHKDVLKLPIKNINDRTITIFFSGNLNYFRLPLYFYLLCGYVPPRIILRGIIFLLRRSSFLRRIFTSYKFDSKFEGSYIRFTSGFKQGLSGDEYSKIISDSKIVLCPKGFNSPESFRHYEAMRAGCVIISEKLPPTYFYKDSPIIQVSDWKEGLKIASKLVNDETELEARSSMTIDWWKSRCSENATAQYMAKCIETVKN